MSSVELSSENAAKAHAPDTVVVHPLVLLSVVDHYTRAQASGRKRVVGVLLGSVFKGKVDVTNSYALPFEESPDEDIWYLDHNYHEEMYHMFKKVNAKERVVGWYHTGPKVRNNDLEINELFRRYVQNPVLCVIDVDPKHDQELPTNAYVAVEEVPEKSQSALGDQNNARRKKHNSSFLHIQSEVGAYEAEEVGVEHLLRGVVDYTVSSSADQIVQKVGSLHGLRRRLLEISQYVDRVCRGELPANAEILYNLQDLFNLLPNLQVKELVDAIKITTNDNHIVMYVAGIIRSILALHDLINNRLENQRHTQELQSKQVEKEKLLAAREKRKAELKANKDKQQLLQQDSDKPEAADADKKKPQ